MQAQWLAYHLSNNLPHTDIMEDYVSREKKWKHTWMPYTSSRASLIQLHMTKYHDVLMQDCKKPLVKNKWWQWFLPITARDFSEST